jgi:predicted RNA-binding protein with PIN domain
MALARILVDGYSLLHNCPGIAEGKARHSAAARDELIEWLTRYQDTAGTPVSVVFDGSGARKTGHDEFARSVEVLFSGAGHTADDLIERAAYRLKPYGDVLVVTDDFAVRDTVIGMGGQAASCDNFMSMLVSALEEQADDIKHHNRNEKNRFNRPHIK